MQMNILKLKTHVNFETAPGTSTLVNITMIALSMFKGWKKKYQHDVASETDFHSNLSFSNWLLHTGCCVFTNQLLASLDNSLILYYSVSFDSITYTDL